MYFVAPCLFKSCLTMPQQVVRPEEGDGVGDGGDGEGDGERAEP